MTLFRLQFGGRHYSDQWSCTIHMNSAAPIDEILGVTDLIPGGLGELVGLPERDNAMENMLDEVVEACTAYVSSDQIANVTTLDFVKFNPIDAETGKYVWSDTTFIRDIDGVHGGISSRRFAPQLAVVATLHTARTRGRASKGRFYMPIAWAQVEDDGRLSDNNVGVFAAVAQSFLNDLNNWNGIDAIGSPEVCVYSPTGGITELVTGVSVGHVIDTMRSRRAQISEGPREILSVS